MWNEDAVQCVKEILSKLDRNEIEYLHDLLEGGNEDILYVETAKMLIEMGAFSGNVPTFEDSASLKPGPEVKTKPLPEPPELLPFGEYRRGSGRILVEMHSSTLGYMYKRRYAGKWTRTHSSITEEELRKWTHVK